MAPELNSDAQELIEENMGFALALHGNYIKKLPRHVDMEALKGAALEGLCHAAKSYDKSKGVGFKAWAARRIIGQMLDEMRTMDHLTRRDRDKLRAGHTFKTDTNAPISMDAHYYNESEETRLIDMIADDSDVPGDHLDTFTHGQFNELMEQLSDQELTVITLRFFDNLRAREVSEQLYISESRVNQIESQALWKMRRHLARKELERDGQPRTEVAAHQTAN
jgi:RNA polymerase sigma factor for flagellar operon FliA